MERWSSVYELNNDFQTTSQAVARISNRTGSQQTI